MMENKTNLPWWKTAIFYHIYPLSFMDSNKDGLGDIPGIIEKLDYLTWLGVDAIWISPLYPTPFKDNGYDIKDFSGIDPAFGTLDDFTNLLQQAHSKNIKIIMDFVPNHTSEEHPWFIEARSDRTNKKRNWYLWADPNPHGGVPNNWMSFAGKWSGWEFDSATNQYYYHSFLKHQPDLNWRNSEVQQAMFDVMHFWLKKGIDGFRIDLMGFLIKDKFLRNNPHNSKHEKDSGLQYPLTPTFSTHQREINQIIAKMRSLVDEYGDKVLLGETYLSVDELVHYHTNEETGVHLPGNYLFVMEDWKANILFEEICNYEASLQEESWPNWVLSNHDNPRIASKLGREQAKVAAFLLFCSRGTLIIYYGDEIGMQDLAISKSQMKDLAETGRDPHRAPMQWSAKANAGFTEGIPWLGVNSDYMEYNVEIEKTDPSSFLYLYRDLINLRKQEPALISGLFIPVGVEENILAFMRRDQKTGRTFFVACNLGHKAASFQIPEFFSPSGTIIYGTKSKRKGEKLEKEIALEGSEAILIQIK
jgi:alpha-glucosidase